MSRGGWWKVQREPNSLDVGRERAEQGNLREFPFTKKQNGGDQHKSTLNMEAHVS